MNPFQFQSYLSLGWELNIYATPAIITLVLLLLETAFLAIALPETRNKAGSHANSSIEKKPASKTNGTQAVPVVSRLRKLATLKKANNLHFAFLMAFSGMNSLI